MKAIYRLDFGCGRDGDLTGIFVANAEKVKILLDNKIQVYFGEVLGKHSEVYGPLDDGELTMVSDDPAAVKMFEDLKLWSGHNPFEYTSINFEHEGINPQDLTINELCDLLLTPSPDNR